MIYNRKGTHLTVLPEKEWLSANTMQEGTRLFGILPFLLYTVLQVALFVFRISLFHSDRLSGHRLHIFHRAPAFLPVSLRFEKDMSQEDLANIVGVTRQTIGLIETGNYNPTLKLCIAICNALDKTLNDLFWEDLQ